MHNTRHKTAKNCLQTSSLAKQSAPSVPYGTLGPHQWTFFRQNRPLWFTGHRFRPASLLAPVRCGLRPESLGSRVDFFGQRYSGFQRHTGAATEAPYYHLSTIVDLFGSCKFNEDVAFDFSAENVGNRYYLDPLSTGLVLAPSRSFKMSLSARFCAFTG